METCFLLKSLVINKFFGKAVIFFLHIMCRFIHCCLKDGHCFLFCIRISELTCVNHYTLKAVLMATSS